MTRARPTLRTIALGAALAVVQALAIPPARAAAEAVETRAPALVLPLTRVGGSELVELQIAGTRLRAYADTGGFRSIGLRPDVAARLPLRFTGRTVDRMDAAGRVSRGREFVIPELRLGGRVFADVPGYERSEGDAARRPDDGGVDAVIGREFLERFTLVVDYPRRRLELHPPAAAARACRGTSTTLFRVRNGFPASEAVTDHGSLIFVWDTGAEGGSAIKERVARNLRLPLVRGRYATTKFEVGGRDLGPLALVPIAIGGALDADGMIGANVFARHKVCLDYAHGRVSVD